MLNYNPSEVKELAGLLDAGIYDASLVGYEEKQSKAGNQMAVLTWKVWDNHGRETLVKDFVVVPATTWKIGAIAKALGKSEEFQNSSFDLEANKGCSIKLKLKIESDKEGKYPDKNVVNGYKESAKSQFMTEVYKEHRGQTEDATEPVFAPGGSNDIPF